MGIIENTINEVSENNSTSTILLGGTTFTGLVENILAFSALEVNIYSDASSINQGLVLTCGQDKELTTGVFTEVDTYTAGTNYHRIFPLKGKYMRIKYTNGGSTQGVFKLQAIKTNQPLNDNGSINNTDTITQQETKVDAFGRLRISNPETVFENNNVYSKSEIYMDELTSGTNATTTYQLSNSAVILSTVDNGDRVVRQSHQYLNYQPGKSLMILGTGVLNPQSANESNVSTYVGYFDDNNGIYFKHNNSNLYVGIRSNTSGTVENREFVQSEWNLDTMDGTGRSGINLDASKTQIFYADIEWLGVGTVRTGFVVDGKFLLCHKFHHANNRENVYMTTANLPMRYEIDASGTTNTSGSLMEICCSVISEGGFEPAGINYSAVNPIARTVSENTEGAIIAIRLKEGFKRAYARLNSFQVLLRDNNDLAIYRLRIYRDVDIISNLFTTATWTSVNTYGEMEVSTNVVYNNISAYNNRIIYEGFAGSDITNFSNHHRGVYLSSNISGTRDIMVLGIYPITANGSDVYGAINWIEHN